MTILARHPYGWCGILPSGVVSSLAVSLFVMSTGVADHGLYPLINGCKQWFFSFLILSSCSLDSLSFLLYWYISFPSLTICYSEERQGKKKCCFICQFSNQLIKLIFNYLSKTIKWCFCCYTYVKYNIISHVIYIIYTKIMDLNLFDMFQSIVLNYPYCCSDSLIIS